ncbi:MAG: phytanoyl-CoA dioxygenase family protein [Niabella sp.]|nr:phytanoyl-CoA dioxygenase family protein [Niabella sp.]
MDHITKKIADFGYAVADSLLPARLTVNLEHELDQIDAYNFNRPVNHCGHLLHCNSITEIVAAPLLIQLVKSLSSYALFPVRAIILDKTEKENWQLPWHQDTKIAVQQHIDVSGYTNWSLEAGIWHVQPPPAVLEELIIIRVHLDPSTEKNGAMHIIPGSHKLGVLSSEQISGVTQKGTQRTLSMKTHSIMVMRPLLLHDSPASQSASRRRVLHLEYGFELNNGLCWYR